MLKAIKYLFNMKRFPIVLMMAAGAFFLDFRLIKDTINREDIHHDIASDPILFEDAG